MTVPRILERALSPAFVRTAPAGMHCDGRGLYLQVTEGKDGKLNRSWIFRYRVNGRSRDMGLGPLVTIGLSEAREKAKTRRQERLDKIDPLEARKLWPSGITCTHAASRYATDIGTAWTPKYARDWSRRWRSHVAPVVGPKDVMFVTPKDIEDIVGEVTEGKGFAEAKHVRGMIESVLDHAGRTGDNPARWNPEFREVVVRPSKNASFRLA